MIKSRGKAAERQRGEDGRNLTSRSTRPLDSMAFMVIFSGLVECCSLAAGYLCVRFLLGLQIKIRMATIKLGYAPYL
jgi:hypothetical protein